MGKRMWISVGVLCAIVTVAAACGGGDDDTFTGPRLAGTPLPTATFPPPEVVVCDVEAPVAAPANFPTDVPFPPGYVLSSVETEPFLHTEGRVKVPNNAFIPEDAVTFLPTTALEVAMLEAMRFTWDMSVNEGEGRDYNFEHPDGRVGHFNIQLILECGEHAGLTFDFPWITPEAAAAPPPA